MPIPKKITIAWVKKKPRKIGSKTLIDSRIPRRFSTNGASLLRQLRLPSISITEAQRLGVEVEEVLAHLTAFFGLAVAVIAELQPDGHAGRQPEQQIGDGDERGTFAEATQRLAEIE